MEHFILTDEILENAIEYMPIEAKQENSKVIAEACTYSITKNSTMGIPALIAEDTTLKRMMLMNILVMFYLNINLEISTDGKENFAKFDYMASGNLLEQLRKYRGTEELKNKANLILEDYKDFKKMVEVELYNFKLAQNDVLTRFADSIQLLSNPEYIEKMSKELQKLTEEYDAKVKEKNN